MSNVVSFENAQKRTPVTNVAGTPKTMTLFIHVKRATLIAHCGNLQNTGAAAEGRVGKSL